MQEVRRDGDGELEGLIVEDGDSWPPITVFHGLLDGHPRERPLSTSCTSGASAVLAERWHWNPGRTGEWRVVVPQEACPGIVRVAMVYYSLPGVETAIISASDLASGDQLTLKAPDDSEQSTED